MAAEDQRCSDQGSHPPNTEHLRSMCQRNTFRKQNDWVRQVRGWKMFLVLPRLLLHRPPRGKVGREKLVSRFLKVSAGQWEDLLRASQQCTEQAATISRRARRRGGQQGFDKRVARAMQLVQLGELSSGRQALEGADLAPGSDATLRALRNLARRPNQPREPVPPIPAHRPFELDEGPFGKSLRSAKRGASGGPSGMTGEHLRPLLEEVVKTIQLGRLAALQKPTGGVRGIVAGEVLRRLVARTMVQQLRPAMGTFTAPFQFALTTRSGCECVAPSRRCAKRILSSL